ncbi:MAG TPA: L-histidine N(alpha)-methyltransferase [Rhizomicrobium sp.]|jgi:dimethylhistidine N-methyltransferase|nr:L-histidine N(alpha)-methyltransferase [Rhizomicrobium sp.]
MSLAAPATDTRLRTSENTFAAALLEGLRRTPKRVPAKFFYDAAGSALFERITGLAEYYPTRTELAILNAHAREMAQLIGKDIELVEFGAGALRKVRLLLDVLQTPRSYIPIDICGDYLLEVAEILESEYPRLCVNPVVADFSQPIAFGPLECKAARRAGFFPGSTIGNFSRPEAIAFLRNARETLNGGGLLIGVDLVKDPAILHAAYNDGEGVTEAFNKNLLLRANRELGADFEIGAFAHHACYNPLAQRVEMYLVSLAAQRVHICGETIAFAQGEAIHTEDSHKYTLDGFRGLAAEAGYVPRRVWTDEAGLFSVQWLGAA